MWLWSRNFRQLAIILLSLLSLLFVQAVFAAKKTSNTQVSVGGDSDSNRQLRVDNEETSSQVNASLNQSFHYQTQRNELSSQVQIKRHEDLDYQELSYNDYILGLDNNTQLQRWQIGATGTYIENSSLVSELESTGITTANKVHRLTKFGLSSRYSINEKSSLFLILNKSNNWYEDSLETGLLDYQSNSVQIGYRIASSQKRSFDLYIFGTQLDIHDTPAVLNNQQSSQGIGFERSWNMNEKNQFVLGGSRQKTQYEYDQFYIFRFFSLQSETLNTQYKLSWLKRFELSSFAINLENGVQEQSNGLSERKELSLNWQTKPSARWNWGIRMTAFVNDRIFDQETENQLIYGELTLSSTYRLEKDQSLNVYIKYRGQDRDLEPNSNTVDAESVSVGFNYQFRNTNFIH